MTIRTEWTLKKWHLYIAAMVLIVTLLSSFANILRGYTVDTTVLQTNDEAQAKAIESNSTRITNLEDSQKLDRIILIELKVNMKSQMKAQGLEYQEYAP